MDSRLPPCKGKAPFLVKLYFATSGWLQKAITASQTCFVGFWLGVLSPERLYATIEEYYGKGYYHDKKYNRSGLLNWEEEAVTKYFKHCRHLLVLGAGGGREVLALLRLGYEVDGFESHPDLVVAANELLKEEGFDPTVQWIVPDKAPEPGNVYDGIIVGWGMYMSIRTRQRRVDFLRQLRTQIAMRCPILLSFIARGEARRYRIGASIANSIRRVLRQERVEIGDWLSPLFVHHFSQDEITHELAEAGFDTSYYGNTEFGHAIGIAT